MEFVLLKRAKNNKPITFVSEKPIVNPKEEPKQVTIPPKIQLETILTDFKVTCYEKIYLTKPTRNDITLTLSKPSESTFIIIKDISGSKKYFTSVVCEDGLKIDDADMLTLENPYESISLLYSKEDDKFYIY